MLCGVNREDAKRHVLVGSVRQMHAKYWCDLLTFPAIPGNVYVHERHIQFSDVDLSDLDRGVIRALVGNRKRSRKNVVICKGCPADFSRHPESLDRLLHGSLVLFTYCVHEAPPSLEFLKVKAHRVEPIRSLCLLRVLLESRFKIPHPHLPRLIALCLQIIELHLNTVLITKSSKL